MSSNFINNSTGINKTEQPVIKIDESIVKRTLKVIAAPVFEFFNQEAAVEEENPFAVNYDEEIKKTEMKSAVIARILKDADPNSRKSFDYTI